MIDEIVFTKKKYVTFKREYDLALKANKKVSLFENKEILTTYAKYMIEYLRTKFEKITNDI